MHSAKGLEFPIVFIAGMEEYLFPHARAMESEQEMEEERRLCYVGITRAQQQLYLTYAQHRNIFGSYTSNMPSRFLDEIPDNLVEHVDLTPGNLWNSENSRNLGYKANSHINNTLTHSKQVKKEFSGETGFSLGQKVIHKKYGKGTIVTLSGEGENQELTIAFDQGGIRKFIAAYAPLKKID